MTAQCSLPVLDSWLRLNTCEPSPISVLTQFDVNSLPLCQTNTAVYKHISCSLHWRKFLDYWYSELKTFLLSNSRFAEWVCGVLCRPWRDSAPSPPLWLYVDTARQLYWPVHSYRPQGTCTRQINVQFTLYIPTSGYWLADTVDVDNAVIE